MKYTFKFTEKFNFWAFISITLIAIGFSLMGLRAFESKPYLNFGIDFMGGNTFHLQLQESSNENTLKMIRESLKSFNLENSQIQLSGEYEVFIKTLELKENKTEQIMSHLKETIGNFEILEIQQIGGNIGNSLKRQSIYIIIFITLSLLIYVTFRFQFNFALSALIALIHDGLIILSVASILMLEINTAFIAALLTILGYSINDTIVIFDRIRENIEKSKATQSLKEITNTALNQTLTRTINTSITTLIVISSLILFGGSTIKEFCIILFIGVVSGTYSSLCIASSTVVKFERFNKINI
ncbi:protein translocase subunit SecF [Candidatus Marinamargulisbacteria bacterium SCGC AG-343-D04]|nr:protein translocase subunit SecF [Candidatus Marinamargulisbacteria bacterium SCGC AG-343-D04]